MDDPSSSTKSEAVAYHFSGAKRSRQELPPGNRLASPVAFTLGACVGVILRARGGARAQPFPPSTQRQSSACAMHSVRSLSLPSSRVPPSTHPFPSPHAPHPPAKPRPRMLMLPIIKPNKARGSVATVAADKEAAS